MIISSIRLHNIRSYLDSSIRLPQGKVLFSGNIGSGKSTVLLALEFALFGLQRGIFDGATLLRNGKKEGYVEIEFEVNNQNIAIRRSLKRSKDTVVQESATLAINNRKKELTAMELKKFVLDVLNYPPSLITKKNLIYRYTVYTPQEEMKKILLEDDESRLDTLRKVFDIDKYKRIISNSELFIADLKEKTKEKEGQLVDLPFKLEQFGRRSEALKETEKKLMELAPVLLSAKQELKQLSQLYDSEQAKVKELNEAKISFTKITSELGEKQMQHDSLAKEEHELIMQTEKLRQELKAKGDMQELLKMKKENEELIKNGRDNETTFERELAVLASVKEKLTEDSRKISILKVCPVCKQQVNEEHKHKITDEIKQELDKNEKEHERKRKILLELKQDIKSLEKQLAEIYEQEKGMLALQLKHSSLNEKESKRLEIMKRIALLNERMTHLKKEKELAMASIARYQHVEKQLELMRQDIEKKQEQEKMLLVQYSGLDQNRKDLAKELKELENELKSKEKVSNELARLRELQEFLSKNFSFLVESMEKRIMLRLSLEFNSLFRKWFSMLVDDPGIDATVDQDFKPMISQQGYEINYEYLSGGERTALALAYRLSLNQVINSMLSRISTKDLLILDEPTDGFSSEQLDRMRHVLEELNTRQLILVSHEQKMEEFVEKVLRFEKHGHESRVIY